MRIQPTQHGRIIAGDTPWGAFNIEVRRSPAIDPGIRRITLIENGVEVGTMTMEIRTPPGTIIDAGDCTPCNQKRAAREAAQPRAETDSYLKAIQDGASGE